MSVETEVSGSIEMYLATIATLQADEHPVPLSDLADELSHSPVSVNEMCRKLVQRGWAAYQPYKGVRLTAEGTALARQVLDRRRLWEEFLRERLGADAREAEVCACQLEHVTPGGLAQRLATYLADPAPSTEDRPTQPMSALAAGQRALVTGIAADEVVTAYLHSQGISPGGELLVLAMSSDDSLLLQTPERHLCISKSLATQVDVQLITEAASSRGPEVAS